MFGDLDLINQHPFGQGKQASPFHHNLAFGYVTIFERVLMEETISLHVNPEGIQGKRGLSPRSAHESIYESNNTHSLPTARKRGRERRGIRPGHAVAERSPPTGERSAERGLALGAAACRVERLSRHILGKHPEVESPVGRTAPDQLAGCFGQQPPADAVPLEPVGHVQVVEESAPVRVLVKDHVNEADYRVALVGDDGEVVRARGRHSRAPHRQAIGEHIPVQERIKVCSPIVPSPAIGMKRRDRLDVMYGRIPESNLLLH